MEPYYYSQMNKVQQNAYHAMKTGLMSMAPLFMVPKLENRELGDIFFQLRLDCPEIFYASGFHYRFYPEANKVEMIPEYLFEKGKIKEHQKAMESRLSKLARPAVDLPEWEKELYIHDFICSSVRYDKLKKAYSHEIIGPLGQGVGVCEGIAKTVKALCDALGIWCMIAISEANPEKRSNTAMPGISSESAENIIIWTQPSIIRWAAGMPYGMIISTWRMPVFSATMSLLFTELLPVTKAVFPTT